MVSSPRNPVLSGRTIIPAHALEEKIAELLDSFYIRHIGRLKELKLDERLRSKNPYLFRAIGVTNASQIVEELMDAHISSSDETIFGNVFFEPLAIWVAEQYFEGMTGTMVVVSQGKGIDIQLSNATVNQAIAVKSGPKVFNAQSRLKQVEEFRTAERILKKDKKLFLAIVGYCYGRKAQREAKDFTEMAGQQLWEHLTGEPNFYLRIIELMKLRLVDHRSTFLVEYAKTKERFVVEFQAKYSFPDDTIDWDKLVEMVSATKIPKETITKTGTKLRSSKTSKPSTL